MKIMDGLRLKGQPAEIPNCSRYDLPGFFKEMGYAVGAEIGVYKGQFSERLCQVGLKLYAIDPWLIYRDYQGTGGQKRMDLLYEGTKKSLAPYDCTILRKTSMDALADIADRSLDFVYIDGNHDFRYVAEDICEWSKKVRVGGTLSGHDYFFKDPSGRTTCVPYVVNAYAATHKINNWYVLGQQKEGKSEMWRSWMWIKSR